MICFPCRCGHRFEEPDDAAGLSVQCPACHLLNDVPTLGNLDSIGLDGTYSMSPRGGRSAPNQLEDTLAVFAQSRPGHDGEIIDLTNPEPESDEIGEYESPEQARHRMRPRYDPETGELIQPIPVARHAATPARESIPFAKAAVTYEASGAIAARSVAQVLLDLVRPLNLLVLFFVVLFHLLLIGSLSAMSIGMFLVLPVLAGLAVIILAHFANVIDEIGVEGRDELPRVLRDLRVHEDILWPFARVVTATLLCFGPAAGALYLPMDPSFASSLAVVLALGGIVFFPAILLTLQTSGSLANLRPDRIRDVMRLVRSKYVAAVITFAIAVVPYGFGMVSLALRVMDVGPFAVHTPAWAGKPALDLPLICVGIFMMHAFCWDLGLIYRNDGEKFPWVGRYHQREKRPPVVRRKARYVR